MKIQTIGLDASIRDLEREYPAHHITGRLFLPTTVNLTQTVTPQELEQLRQLRNQLVKEKGQNLLQLDMAVDVEGRTTLLMPPVVVMQRKEIQFQSKPGELSYDRLFSVVIPEVQTGNNIAALAAHISTPQSPEPFTGFVVTEKDQKQEHPLEDTDLDVRIDGIIEMPELLQLFEDVKLKDQDIQPYKNAKIALMALMPNDYNLTTYYALKGNLQFQHNLRRALLKQGIDTLALDKGYRITINGETKDLLPPIVEVMTHDYKIDAQGQTQSAQIPYLLDGVHRALLARILGIPLTVAYVSGINPQCPGYSFLTSWDDVQIMEKVPATMAEKKPYRLEVANKLYRIFGKSGQPRGVSN